MNIASPQFKKLLLKRCGSQDSETLALSIHLLHTCLFFNSITITLTLLKRFRRNAEQLATIFRSHLSTNHIPIPFYCFSTFLLCSPRILNQMSDAADDVQIVFDSKPYKQPDEGLMGKNIAIAEKEMFCHLKIPPIILPHWIPGAEDVEIINEMLVLKDETVKYICLQYTQNKLLPPFFPMFYSTSIYFLYRKILINRQQPIYLQNLGEVIKLRINEMFPGFCEVLHVPTLEGIIQHFATFNNYYVDKFPHMRPRIISCFEKILGETFFYYKRSYTDLKISPPVPSFLIKTICLYYSSGFRTLNGESVEHHTLSRLQRNLQEINPKVFEHGQRQLEHHLRCVDRFFPTPYKI